jgi:hypothetical protein
VFTDAVTVMVCSFPERRVSELGAGRPRRALHGEMGLNPRPTGL